MSMMHAPQLGKAPSTAHVMRWVIAATLPGLAVMTLYFGLGILSNVLIAALWAVAAEALVLRLRHRPIWPTLNDSSALLTGVLLGASLPPASPWWLIGVGVIAAVVVAKLRTAVVVAPGGAGVTSMVRWIFGKIHLGSDLGKQGCFTVRAGVRATRICGVGP